MSGTARLVRHDAMHSGRDVSLFFVATFVFSWIVWGVSIVANGMNSAPGVLCLALGGFAPSLIAVAMVWPAGTEARTEFLSRTISRHRLSVAIAVIAFLAPIVMLALSFAASLAVGGGGSALKPGPVGLVTLLLSSLLLGPLAEELGWRGYALDALQSRFGPALGTFVLGMAWAAWHAPLFFVAGTVQQEIAGDPVAVAAFCSAIVGDTFLMTGIYNRTDRSILSGILFHWGKDYASDLFTMVPAARVFRALISLAAAAVIVLTRNLGRPVARPTVATQPSPVGVR